MQHFLMQMFRHSIILSEIWNDNPLNRLFIFLYAVFYLK